MIAGGHSSLCQRYVVKDDLHPERYNDTVGALGLRSTVREGSPDSKSDAPQPEFLSMVDDSVRVLLCPEVARRRKHRLVAFCSSPAERDLLGCYDKGGLILRDRLCLSSGNLPATVGCRGRDLSRFLGVRLLAQGTTTDELVCPHLEAV